MPDAHIVSELHHTNIRDNMNTLQRTLSSELSCHVLKIVQVCTSEKETPLLGATLGKRRPTKQKKSLKRHVRNGL